MYTLGIDQASQVSAGVGFWMGVFEHVMTDVSAGMAGAVATVATGNPIVGIVVAGAVDELDVYEINKLNASLN